MSRVIIPINVKLNAFILILLSASIVFYVYYAVNLFESDKMAYVFESIKSQNLALTKNINAKIERNKFLLSSLSSVRYSTRALKEMFESSQYIKAFVELKNKSIIRSIHDQKLSDAELSKLISGIETSDEKDFTFIKYHESDAIVLNIVSGGSTFLGIFDNTLLTDSLDQNRLFNYGLMDRESKKWLKGQMLFEQDIYQSTNANIEKMKVSEGTFIMSLDEQNWIVAFDTLNEESLVFLTLVEEKKALEASQMLKHKSIYFGSFVLSLAILMSFLFSKIFTIPIKKLYEGSRNFVAQNFGTRVQVSSWDELGVLADSFNTMADDIENYMGQMEEKNRLENELKTAQLVQNSFFEGENLQKGPFKLSAFYRPASECGGDWWGSIEKDDKLIMIVVDATGHGTAAALITAVIHNCQTALNYLMKLDDHYLTSSAYIMDYLNQSVCNVRSNLMATAFVAIIDNKNNKLVYTNASHNPPLVLKAKNSQMQKDDIVPLMDKLGKRLGEDSTSKYEEVVMDLSSKQRLLFYTDGLVEGENHEGKQWGKRKLIKMIISNQDADSKTIVDSIVTDAYNFFGDTPQADDICIVGVEMS